MSKLLTLRQKLNLTQEELSEKSGVSVRTIQRIEAGTIPKGYTLKALVNGLGISEAELLEPIEEITTDNGKWLKIINLSVLPFVLVPPLNIFAPLAIMIVKKQFTPVTRMILSIQILWTILAFVLFLMTMMLNDWFHVSSKFTLLIPIVWVFFNGVIILRNAAEIARNNTLRIRLKFGII